jgi:hypothetical protein
MPASCRAVTRPETREIVPRTAWPNFRDHGKSVDAALLRVLCNLQRAHGWSYVTEAGLRKMICEDLGHMPGMDTVRRALDRLAWQGLLHQVWLLKGGVLPDGNVASAGVRLIRVALSRAERASFLARVRRGREKTTGRVNHRALFDLMSAQRKLAPPTPPVADATRMLEERRRAQLAAARELEARWALEDGPAPAS